MKYCGGGDVGTLSAYSDDGGIEAKPAVRANARNLNVDLATMTPAGEPGRFLNARIADLQLARYSGGDLPR